MKSKAYITIEIACRIGSKEIEERLIRVNTSNPMFAEYMKWYRQPCSQGIATDDAGNNKGVNNSYLKDVTNVLLSPEEYQSLMNEFGEQKFETSISEYSNWKCRVNAHPKSDFDSL